MPGLRLDWCSYQAASFAVRHWHYSGSMPCGKSVKVGVWEDGRFIGAVIFAYGANRFHGNAFGLRQQEVCELVRVALDEHETPVSRILSIAVKFLRIHCPGIKLIVSYADCDQNHHGGIYAAAGWTYVGLVESGGKGTPMYLVRGRVLHGRTVASRGWKQNIDWLRKHVDPKAEKVIPTGKHKYFLALNPEIKNALAPMARPYPKRSKELESGNQPDEGGATPTRPLQIFSHEQ